jgi:hypothetical protein
VPGRVGTKQSPDVPDRLPLPLPLPLPPPLRLRLSLPPPADLDLDLDLDLGLVKTTMPVVCATFVTRMNPSH